MQEDEKLVKLRKRIDATDTQIIELLKNRFALAKEIGHVKRKTGRAIPQPVREHELIVSRRELAKRAGLDADFTEELFKQIMAASRKIQEADDE